MKRILATAVLSIVLSVASAMVATSQAQSIAPSLGSAATYAVLAAPSAAGAVTCTSSVITGDIGSSGASAAVVETGCLLAGAVIAPVPTKVISDFNIAYDTVKSLPCTQTFTVATLVNQTFTPGVYCFDVALTMTGSVITLDGPATGIWVFKIGTSGVGALTGTNLSMVTKNGASCNNVLWESAGAVTMTGSSVIGTVLSGAAATLTGGTFNGGLLAKGAVTVTGPSSVTVCDGMFGGNGGNSGGTGGGTGGGGIGPPSGIIHYDCFGMKADDNDDHDNRDNDHGHHVTDRLLVCVASPSNFKLDAAELEALEKGEK